MAETQIQIHHSASLQNIRRFDFFRLQDFARPEPEMLSFEALPLVEETPPPPPPPPTFSESELEQVRKDAFAEGVRDGIRQGTDSQKQQDIEAATRQAQAMQQLAVSLQAAEQVMAKQLEAQHKQLLELASGLAIKLAGEALAANYVQSFEQLLRQTMPAIISMPALVIKTHEASVPEALRLMQKLSIEYGFKGRYEVVTAQGMNAGDMRIEWQFGAAERNIAQMIAAIGKHIPVPEHYLPEPLPPAPEPALVMAEMVADNAGIDIQQRLQALRARKST